MDDAHDLVSLELEVVGRHVSYKTKFQRGFKKNIQCVVRTNFFTGSAGRVGSPVIQATWEARTEGWLEFAWLLPPGEWIL